MTDQIRESPVGELRLIGVRPTIHAPMRIMPEVECISDLGLVGDRYQKPGGHRQVTLVQEEHLPAIASILGKLEIDPVLLRRNLVVRGINLMALRDAAFTIGEATLVGTGLCEPCEQMNAALGPGGKTAMIGHGGITARVLRGGIIRIGDPVKPSPV